MKAKLISQKRKKQTIDIPASIFDVKFNKSLVYQVVTSQQKQRQIPAAHTKGRKEVRGGGRKPWPQKGTGRARHGSIRSPLWKGGGVTFGPTKEKSFKQKINKKMRKKALFAVFSEKLRDDEIIFVDKFKLQEPKTKKLKKQIESLIPEVNKKTLILTSPERKEIHLACRNLPYYNTMPAKEANALDLLRYKHIIIPKESLKVIKNTFLD